MLNANELLKEGIKQVKEAGIVPGNINPNVIVNTRAKMRLGRCTIVINGEYDYVIEINHELLEGKKKNAMNTMVHEILHSCKGCLNHGPLWKSYAETMNRKFGYTISRFATKESSGLKRPAPKYIIKCIKCKHEYHRLKRSKIVTHVENYRCGKCVKGKLIVIKN